MVNVPQAVWIDERGAIVRPTEPAGAYEGFRRMDRVTREVPADAARLTAEAKAIYLNAIRDWVRRGNASEHVLETERARARLPQPSENVARAHVAFKLGQHLIRHGQAPEGDRWLAEASRLHPGLLGHLAPARRRDRSRPRRPAGLLGARRRSRRQALLLADRHAGDALPPVLGGLRLPPTPPLPTPQFGDHPDGARPASTRWMLSKPFR